MQPRNLKKKFLEELISKEGFKTLSSQKNIKWTVEKRKFPKWLGHCSQEAFGKMNIFPVKLTVENNTFLF